MPSLVARVSVVIPVRDDPRIRRCVASIAALRSEAHELEIVVVDHRSRPGFEETLAGVAGSARVLRYDGETVYGARNAGVAASGGDVVLFTDADCIVRPGWIAEALRSVAAGADLAQGFSGTVQEDGVAALLQARSAAPFRRLKAGDPVECDTRNLAVRRAVFERVRFREEFRRVGDTELGLVAQSLGFTVHYAPRMNVDHEHEPDIPLFAAKQVCHGWGAQRLMAERPDLQWNGGHLRAVAAVSRRVGRLPGSHLGARLMARAVLGAARALQRGQHLLPFPAALLALGAIDKAGLLAGHLGFRAGAPEPAPSVLLGRPPVRD